MIGCVTISALLLGLASIVSPIQANDELAVDHKSDNYHMEIPYHPQVPPSYIREEVRAASSQNMDEMMQIFAQMVKEVFDPNFKRGFTYWPLLVARIYKTIKDSKARDAANNVRADLPKQYCKDSGNFLSSTVDQSAIEEAHMQFKGQDEDLKELRQDLAGMFECLREGAKESKVAGYVDLSNGRMNGEPLLTWFGKRLAIARRYGYKGFLGLVGKVAGFYPRLC